MKKLLFLLFLSTTFGSVPLSKSVLFDNDKSTGLEIYSYELDVNTLPSTNKKVTYHGIVLHFVPNNGNLYIYNSNQKPTHVYFLNSTKSTVTIWIYNYSNTKLVWQGKTPLKLLEIELIATSEGKARFILTPVDPVYNVSPSH